MSRKNLQIVSKLGLLLVVFGFFMPVSCNLNGFELASTLNKIGDSGSIASVVSVLMYFLFVISIVGVIRLLVKIPSIGVDWIILLLSVGSGTISYFVMKDVFDFTLIIQGGAYMMLGGWTLSIVSLVWAVTIKDIPSNYHPKTSSHNLLINNDKTFQKYSYLQNEAEKTNTTKQLSIHQEYIKTETFDFVNSVVMDWPVELDSGYVLEKKSSTDEATLFGQIDLKIVQNAPIKYMVWQLDCIDLLDKPISGFVPVTIRHEELVKRGELVSLKSDIPLPKGTKRFIPHLKTVLFQDGNVIEYPDNLKKVLIEKQKEIPSEYFELLKIYSSDNHFSILPKYFYDKHESGIWSCAFCGTRNLENVIKCRYCDIGLEGQNLYTEESLLEATKTYAAQLAKIEEDRRSLQEERYQAAQEEIREEKEKKKAEDAKYWAQKKEKEQQGRRNKIMLVITLFLLLLGIVFGSMI